MSDHVETHRVNRSHICGVFPKSAKVDSIDVKIDISIKFQNVLQMSLRSTLWVSASLHI